VEAGAVAAELAIVGNDAVAGHDDANGVGGVGLAHRAGDVGRLEAAGESGVAARLAVGDLDQSSPDAELERRALGLERQVEAAKCALEVKLKLAAGFAQHRVVVVAGPGGIGAEVAQVEAQEGIAGGYQAQRKIGVRLHHGVVEHAYSFAGSGGRGSGWYNVKFACRVSGRLGPLLRENWCC